MSKTLFKWFKRKTSPHLHRHCKHSTRNFWIQIVCMRFHYTIRSIPICPAHQLQGLCSCAVTRPIQETGGRSQGHMGTEGLGGRKALGHDGPPSWTVSINLGSGTAALPVPASQPLDLPANSDYIWLSITFLSLTYSMIWSKRVKEGLWVAPFPYNFSPPSADSCQPSPSSRDPTPQQLPHHTSFVSFLLPSNHATRKSFLLFSALGFLGTGTHHGFPVFLSHLEALLSLFISLGEESKREAMWGQSTHSQSHSPSRIIRIIRMSPSTKKCPFSVRNLSSRGLP